MANGLTYYLQDRTNLSSLFPQFDANEDLEPIIECSGYDLILNEGCNCVDPDRITSPGGQPAIYNITIKNGGTTNKLILEDKSRIRLKATLPTNVCPFVNPDKPLPYCDPVTGSYVTGLTANARCEIQLSGNFALGGGPASLPTEQRPGNWYGNQINYVKQDDIKTISFLDDFNIHEGDIIAPASWNLYRCKILSYDSITYSAIIETPMETFPSYWYSCSGGIVIHSLISNKNTPFINADTVGGTINLIAENTSNQTINLFDNCCCNIKRCCSTLDITTTNTTGSNKTNSSLLGKTLTLKIDEVGAGYLTSDFGSRDSSGAINFITETVVCGIIGGYYNNHSTTNINRTPIDQKIILKTVINGTSNANFITMVGKLGKEWEIRNSPNVSVSPSYIYSRKSYVHLINCGNILERLVEKDGTVTRVLRSDFPLTTDLPNAWHHVPVNATNATWRYEEHFIRNGETFTFNCKFLPGDENTVAKIAITDDNYWFPISHGIIPAFVEHSFENKNPLEWEYGYITYKNDLGYDRQIRFWEIVFGSTEGGYIKSWRASGGVL